MLLSCHPAKGQGTWGYHPAVVERGTGRTAGAAPHGVTHPPVAGEDDRCEFAGWKRWAGVPVYTVLHTPPAGLLRDTGVLLLPPLGWDEVCSYRSRRHWAIGLAEAGFVTARIDLPGSGESAGMPGDLKLMDRWRDTVAEAVSWLRDAHERERIAVIGIGLGGMLAVQALADGVGIDDLVLWGVPARGRGLLREMEMHHRIASAVYREDEDVAPSEDGTVAFTGFPVTTATAEVIRGLQLDKLELPDLSGAAALVVGRGTRGMGVDAGLVSRLESAGADVKVESGTDYPALMAPPTLPALPRVTPPAAIRWLQGRSALSPVEGFGSAAGARPAAVASFTHGDLSVKESIVSLPGVAGRITGVLTEPAAGPRAPFCVVLLNGGPVRRIGPNRMWVQMSRRWAVRGVPVVRMDLEGMGDSDGDGLLYGDMAHLHSKELDAQAIGLIDLLQEAGVADRFVFTGLCASAYWAWQAALADPRVIGAWLVNLVWVKWTRRLEAERNRAHTRRVLGAGLPERMSRGRLAGFTFADVRRALRAFRPSLAWRFGSAELAQGGLIRHSLDTLRDRGTDVLMLFSQDEPLYDQFRRVGVLEQLAEWPNVALLQLPSRDHNVRALWLQAMVHEQLDAALDRLLARST